MMDSRIRFKRKNHLVLRSHRGSSRRLSFKISEIDIGTQHVIEAIMKVADPRGATTRDVVAWVRTNYAPRAPFIVVKVKRALNHAIRDGRVEMIAGRYKILNPNLSKRETSEKIEALPLAEVSIQNSSTVRPYSCGYENINKRHLNDFMNYEKLACNKKFISRNFKPVNKCTQRPRTSHVAIQCLLSKTENIMEKFQNRIFKWESSSNSEESQSQKPT